MFDVRWGEYGEVCAKQLSVNCIEVSKISCMLVRARANSQRGDYVHCQFVDSLRFKPCDVTMG